MQTMTARNGRTRRLALLGLFAAAALIGAAGAAKADPKVKYVQVDPAYPYRQGHYKSADAYFRYPPYTAERPGFYPRRFLLSPREHNRYRYRPHIFTAAEANGEYGQ